MYLQCCTVQNKRQRIGQSVSAHSVPQNTGKTQRASTFYIVYPYSPRSYTSRAYKSAPPHQMLLLSKATSLFCLCSRSLHHPEVKDELNSVRSCNCTTFPRRLLMSFQTLPTKLSPVLQLGNIITRVASTYYLTWNTWKDFAQHSWLSDQERCCAAYQ